MGCLQAQVDGEAGRSRVRFAVEARAQLCRRRLQAVTLFRKKMLIRALSPPLPDGEAASQQVSVPLTCCADPCPICFTTAPPNRGIYRDWGCIQCVARPEFCQLGDSANTAKCSVLNTRGNLQVMTEHAWPQSTELSIGLEEECFLVPGEAGGDEPPSADLLLDSEWRSQSVAGGWLKAELLRCSCELTTVVSTNIAQLDADLAALRSEAARRAEALGWRIAIHGVHPSIEVTPDLITPTRIHQEIAGLHADTGQLEDQVIHGVHVHVGVRDLDSAVVVTQSLAAYAPLVIALTANSPVMHGKRTVWMSARAEIIRRCLWGGPTPAITSASEFRETLRLHQLENSAPQRFQWDVSPVPAYGTVEFRAIDANIDERATLAVAAFIQAAAAQALDGAPVPRPNEALDRHNRWSAAKFGARAQFLVDGRQSPVPVSELVHEAVDALLPYATTLGASGWLEHLAWLLNAPPAEAALNAFESGGVDELLEGAVCRSA